MESRRFYTSPVNHHNLEEWGELASRLEAAVRESAPGVSVEAGEEPVFGYGIDGDAVLETLGERGAGSRHVRIDLWSSIVLYETLAVTFGAGIKPPERTAIVRRLEDEELAEQTFLRAHEGPYDEEAVQVYGYSLDGLDESDIEMLFVAFDGALYIGRRSLISDEDGEIDEDAFEVLDGRDVVTFFVLNSRAERALWNRAGHGEDEGLIVVYPDDPAADELLARFPDFEDLRILLREHPSANLRVTLGRCHMDDSLVVIYAPPGEPDIDQVLLFAI